MSAVDTNVLIYTCERRDARLRSIANDLIDALDDGVLLRQVACEVLAAPRRGRRSRESRL